jgi:dTDP-4-dehydrorhamnose reductase
MSKETGAGFVYISTDSVFDGKKGHYSELDPPAPLNVYGESKLAGEKSVLDEHAQCMIIRTNIYGWNIQRKLSLAEWILERLKSRETVPGFYDVLFTPILANDLSIIILEMMDLGLEGLYHVAGSETISKYEFAKQVAKVFGLEEDLVQHKSVVDSTLKAERPNNISLQTTKVSVAIGQEMPNIENGLKRFKFLKANGYVDGLKAGMGG